MGMERKSGFQNPPFEQVQSGRPAAAASARIVEQWSSPVMILFFLGVAKVRNGCSIKDLWLASSS